jgi:transcriptional regulator with XRE-family HTH domain
MSIEQFHIMIGRRIMRFREMRGLTTTELAKRVGISQAQISRLENAKQGFRSATLFKIADALDVPVIVFLLPEASEIKSESKNEVLNGLQAIAKGLHDPKYTAKITKEMTGVQK